MTNIYKLHNQVKHYEWGSPDLIPRLMGVAPNSTPWAELWMGNNSTIEAPDNPGGKISLGEQYGGLPFLFKLLAAEKPLSIQVHPNLEQAREGFERENKEGLALDDPVRNYRDPNHKPEIICALTPFTGMCGFRKPAEIRKLFAVFNTAPSPLRENFTHVLQALEVPDPASALQHFFQWLVCSPPPVRTALAKFVLSTSATPATPDESAEWSLVRQFAKLYPGDMAMLSPLYLNVFRLEPGEALFLQAGVPHAYIHGFGVELMANSDNVLRGGLTVKHIDIFELMKVLDYNPLELQIIKPQVADGRFTYPVPCEEFSLTVMHGGGVEQTFTPNTHAICVVTEGEVSIGGGKTDVVANAAIVLKQGESAFIPPGNSPLTLQGNYTLYTASAGGAARVPK